MSKTTNLRLIGTILILFISLFVLLTFMAMPGRLNFLQRSGVLFEWRLLLPKLVRINIFELLGNQLIALSEIFLFGVICVSFGLFLLKSIRITKNHKISGIFDQISFLSTAFLLGQGTLSLIFIMLGGYDHLAPQFVVLILVSGFLIGIRSWSALGRKITFQQIKDGLKGFTRIEKLVLGVSIGFILISMLLSASRLSYDSVAVYFSDAKLTALSNAIEFFQTRKYLVSNFQTGILFSVLIQLFGDQAARMLSWESSFVIIVFGISIARKVGLSKRASLIVLVMLLTTTAFVDLVGDGKVEVNSTAFVIASVYWLIVSLASSTASVYFLIGLLVGFAVIARPYNIPLLGAFIGLFYFWQMITTRKEKSFLALKTYLPFVWIGVGVFLLIGFYLFADWLLLGSPLDPVQSTQKINLETWQWSINEQYLWLLKLFYLFVVTYVNTSQSLGNISPLVMAALPLLFIKQVRERIPRLDLLLQLSFVALLVLGLWLLATHVVLEIRYVFFLWIILYLPAAAVLASAPDLEALHLRKFVDLLLIITLVFSAGRILYIMVDSYSPISRSGEPQCYDMPFCELVRPVNEYASPGDRVLTLNAYRYYLRTPLFTCSTGPEEYEILTELSHRNPIDFWTEVYRQGYQYIIYEPNLSNRHLRLGIDLSNGSLLPSWISLETIYVAPENKGFVYQIHVQNPSVGVEKICTQNEAGIWQVQTVDD